MHCRCCDKLLSEFEATRKNAHTMEYLDLCKVCFEDVKGLFPVIERKDLITQADLDTEGDDDSLETDTGDCRDYIDYIDSRDHYDV